MTTDAEEGVHNKTTSGGIHDVSVNTHQQSQAIMQEIMEVQEQVKSLLSTEKISLAATGATDKKKE